MPSLETQEPTKRFIDKKCIQNSSKKLSSENKVYSSSNPQYKSNILNKC